MKKESFTKKIVVCCFILFMAATAAALFISPNKTVSKSERRRLAAKPDFSLENILDESFMEDFEEYLLDHFPFRDTLRRIKAYFSYDILRQKQNNGIYVVQNHASKLEYPVDESSVKYLADKMMALKDRYFPDNTVYYAAVPDKNMFLAPKLGYPYIGYDEIVGKLSKNLDNSFINISLIESLTIDDYYRTDTHWKQEGILKTAQVIAESMGFSDNINLSADNFMENKVNDFYGVYYGQSALSMNPDTITYLTNEAINSASVWNVEDDLLKSVYQLDKLEGDTSFDKYDIFLGGASPVEIIKSPKANTNRRLIIFRDSYTSSLAPLFLEAYSEISLIDLRYISSDLIGEYVDFEDADILFLYGTSIINNAKILK